MNLEYLAKLIIEEEHRHELSTRFVYPDTSIGTDTHTTISNGFGVLSYSTLKAIGPDRCERLSIVTFLFRRRHY
jgi:hypothetical protein